MSAQSGPDVAALLVDTHRWLGGGPIGDCACGWRRAWNDKRGEYIQHATHLDQVIREAYADWAKSAFPETLHEHIDGDFLLANAGGYEKDLPINQCGAADVVRWANTALADLLRGQA